MRLRRLQCVHSLAYNNMGAEGTVALAKVLAQTKIESLECAAACDSAR